MKHIVFSYRERHRETQKVDKQAALSFLLLAYFTMYCYALSGSQRDSWGYSELYVNYSGGFIRRGLTGEILLNFFKITGIDPYFLVVTTNFILLVAIAVLYINSIWGLNFSSLGFRFLAYNPVLLLAPLLSGTFTRKDWILVLLIFLHRYFLEKNPNIREFNFKSALYLGTLLFALSITLLIHEISILFLPIHIYLVDKCLNNCRSLIKKIVLIIIVTSQTLILVAVGYFHGTTEQLKTIKSVIPKELGVNDSVLETASWSIHQNLSLISQILQNPIELVIYFLCFLLGPIALYVYICRQEFLMSYSQSLLIVPLFSLFALGSDWGRWLVLVSFAIVAIMLPLTTDVNKNVDFQSHRSKHTQKLKLASANFGFFAFMLLWKIPACCATDISSLLSPIGFHIFNVLK
jgi:hypothetical protein